jgi:hypothetical protein
MRICSSIHIALVTAGTAGSLKFLDWRFVANPLLSAGKLEIDEFSLQFAEV